MATASNTSSDEIRLPEFGPDPSFFNVAGEPVSVAKGEVFVWRDGKPLTFPLEATLKGDLISEARFRDMVAGGNLDRQPGDAPADLTKMPLSQYSQLLAAEIVENLRRKSSNPDDYDVTP
jgi:hypothetical protein